MDYDTIQRLRFLVAGPRCWNNLPAVIRLADSVESFKTKLGPICLLRLTLLSIMVLCRYPCNSMAMLQHHRNCYYYYYYNPSAGKTESEWLSSIALREECLTCAY